MARTKTLESVDARIKKAQEAVERTKARYDAAISELGALYDERKALQVRELASAIEKSGKSYEEVLGFVKNGKR
ncbi:MAG: hypothetical protein JEY71_16125 [Sphaerochaeta sp.]|nr:hypothetical protein [Sphaerochaeta sp.]